MKPFNHMILQVGSKPFRYIFLLMLLSPFSSWAQGSPPPYYGEIEFQYDARGNRVLRQIYVYPPSIGQVPDSTKVNKDQTSEEPVAANEQVKEEAMQKALSLGISVYPNPTEAMVNVTINALQNGKEAELMLFDNLGRLITRKKQTSGVDTINLETLNTGIYFIQIVMEKERLVYKVIKQ